MTVQSSYALGFSSQRAELDRASLPVKGSFPPWLSGRLIRTVPSVFEFGKVELRHWFDGLAMLHSFDFALGEVTHACKLLRSNAYKALSESGSLATAEFGSRPEGFLNRIKGILNPSFTDNGNVNVIKIGDQYVAVTETTKALAFDPATLQTLGQLEFKDRLNLTTTTAHPHIDFETGEMFNVGTVFGAKSFYKVFKILPGSTTRQLIAKIPVKNPGYIHSFALTSKYILIFEFPLLVNPLDLKLSGKPYIQNFKWCPEEGTQIIGISRQDAHVAFKYRTQAMFSFHQVNAFQRPDETLVVDMLAYHEPNIIESLYLSSLRAGAPIPAASYIRLQIDPLLEDEVSIEEQSKEKVELPQINYKRCNGKPYRFMWAAAKSEHSPFLDKLIKFDLAQARQEVWSEPNCFPGEPVFVARPDQNNTPEDDGVILSVVLDATSENSFLLALDAATMKERGRAVLPTHIPFGFHGSFW